MQEAPYDVLHFSGRDVLDLLHRLSTNAVAHLPEGGTEETVLTTEKGRIVDLLLLGHFPDGILVLCSNGRGGAVLDWVEKFTITDDVKGSDLTHDIAVATLVGPQAISTLSEACQLELQDGECVLDEGAGVWCVSHAGPRGSRVVLGGNRDALDAIMQRVDVPMVGPEAAELLRIRLGMPAAPGELNGDYTPYDVGLADLISFTKGCYVGQEVIARLDAYGKASRGLIGLEMSSEVCEMAETTIHKGSAQIGRLTSCVREGDRAFGLGVVRVEGVQTGDELEVRSGDSALAGRVVMLAAGGRVA